MALGEALWTGAQSTWAGAQAVSGAAVKVVNSARFNKGSYKEAQGYHLTAKGEMNSGNEAGDWDWVNIDRVKCNLTLPQEPYMVESTTSQATYLGHKLSEKAIENAGEAAGVSFVYTKAALKFIAKEAAHDVGFLLNSKTAADAVRAVQRKYPLLKDIQAAYRDGRSKGTSRKSSSDLSHLTRRYAPVQGINDPRDVRMPSNLDDMPIISDHTISKAQTSHRNKPIYDPETGAELQIVYEPARGHRRTREPTQQQDYVSTKESVFHGEFDDVDLHLENEADDEDYGSGVALNGTSREEELTYSGPLFGSASDNSRKF